MAALLIVEPASPWRDELERTLTDAGHRVVLPRRRRDGAAALGAPSAIDAAILDEAAPRLNGITMALRMKAESPSTFMPILIITTRDTNGAHRGPGRNDDVAGLSDARELVARVTALLRTPRVRRRAAPAAESAMPRPTPIRRPGCAIARSGERIGEEFKAAVRYNELLSLILINVEGMGGVHRQHGIGSADSRAAGGIHGTTPATTTSMIDNVTRYGAYEPLAALLPNTHLAGALTCADRLRRESATAGIDEVRAVVSMGIAFYPGKDVNDAADLMRMAARALERARQEGAGSVCSYQHQGYLFQPK